MKKEYIIAPGIVHGFLLLHLLDFSHDVLQCNVPYHPAVTRVVAVVAEHDNHSRRHFFFASWRSAVVFSLFSMDVRLRQLVAVQVYVPFPDKKLIALNRDTAVHKYLILRRD